MANNNINFKGMLKRVSQQEQQYSSNQVIPRQRQKQNKQKGAKEDPYKYITSRLESQQFQKGQLRSNIQPISQNSRQRQHTGYAKRKHRESCYSQIQCDEQLYRNKQLSSGVQQPSLLSSNNPQQPSLFQSRLHQTKDQLQEQLCELQQKLSSKLELQHNFIEQYIDKKLKQCRTEYQNGFTQIVNQLNTNLQSLKSKNKKTNMQLQQQQQNFGQFQLKYQQYIIQVEEKLQRLLCVSNGGGDVSASLQISRSANQAGMSYAGDYALDLKSSMKDITSQNVPEQKGICSNQQEIQEYKQKIQQMQQQIHSIKAQFSGLNSKIECTKIQSQERKREKSQQSMLEQTRQQLKTFQQKINKRISEIFNEITNFNNSTKQLRQNIQIYQENMKGINEEFKKVTNHQLNPRIRKLEQTMNSHQLSITSSQSQIKNIKLELPSVKNVKKQLLLDLQPASIMRARLPSDIQKTKITKATQKKQEHGTYLLDEGNYLMDCYGVYLLDQNNKRVQLAQQQVYYLLNVEQMPINTVV